MKREVVVSALAFSEEGVDIQFMVLPDDVRSEGHIVIARSVSISFEAPGTLGSSTSDLRTSVEDLVSKLLDDLEDLPVYEPAATESGMTPAQLAFQAVDDADDDDVGMGDGR